MSDAMNHNGDARVSTIARWRNGNGMSDFFFEELKEYIGFDRAVEEHLLQCAPIVEPHFLAIAGSFYHALNANRRTRNVFEGPEQIARLEKTLQVWLREAFFGPWGSDYFHRRVRIGQVHVQVGLLPHFMGGAMNIIRRHVMRVLLEADGFGIEHVEAVERLLDLELTVMMQAYWDHMMKLKLELPLALATGLAHEIRNPLNAIALNLTLLERRLKNQGLSESSHIVDAARDEVRRITTLTTDLMDFAKPLELSLVWTRADRLLEELEKIHRPQFEASGIELNTAVEGSPDVFLDPDRIRQALLNLLTNAHEAIASRPDNRGGAVTVTVDNGSETTTIEVTDDGPGVSPEVVYKMFDLFFTAKAAGTGLGLPIVRKIVEAHGGTIDAESRPGEGATFVMRLPRPAEKPRGVK